MNRYIEQLLEDIQYSASLAEGRLKNWNKFDNLDADCVFDDEVDTSGVKLSELFSIDKMFFPDRKRLNQKQISQLADAMEELWKAYGLNPVFPDNVSDEVRYCQMREHLDHETYPVYGKVVDVELCDYLPEHCPLFNWCPLAAENSTVSTDINEN